MSTAMDFWSLSLAHSDVSYTTGSYPCLYCLIPNKNMATPLSARGHAPPRSLHSIHTHHQKYLASGRVRKTAQQFYNCICEHIFDIPTEQVLRHDMHAHVLTLYYSRSAHLTCISLWGFLQSFLNSLKIYATL